MLNTINRGCATVHWLQCPLAAILSSHHRRLAIHKASLQGLATIGKTFLSTKETESWIWLVNYIYTWWIHAKLALLIYWEYRFPISTEVLSYLLKVFLALPARKFKNNLPVIWKNQLPQATLSPVTWSNQWLAAPSGEKRLEIKDLWVCSIPLLEANDIKKK